MKLITRVFSALAVTDMNCLFRKLMLSLGEYYPLVHAPWMPVFASKTKESLLNTVLLCGGAGIRIRAAPCCMCAGQE